MTVSVVFMRHQGMHFSEHAATSAHALRAVKVVVPLDGATLWVNQPGQHPRACHRTIVTPPMVQQTMRIDGPCLALFYEPDDAFSCLLRRFHPTHGLVMLGDQEHRRLVACIGAHVYDLSHDALASSILATCFDILTHHDDRPVHKDRRVILTQRTLQANWQAPPTLETLAHQAGLSTFRLAHLFKRDIFMPMRAYTRWIRLMQALTTPTAQDDTLTTLAHQSSFSDLAHLSRTAKQSFGQCPSYIQTQPSKIVQAYMPLSM